MPLQQGDRLIGIKAVVTRYISDEPQPGWAECEMTDAHGRVWRFNDKLIFLDSTGDMRADSRFPLPTAIYCRVIERRTTDTGFDVVVVDTDFPYYLESVEGETKFEVVPTELVELNFLCSDVRPWNGIA